MSASPCLSRSYWILMMRTFSLPSGRRRPLLIADPEPIKRGIIFEGRSRQRATCHLDSPMVHSKHFNFIQRMMPNLGGRRRSGLFVHKGWVGLVASANTKGHIYSWKGEYMNKKKSRRCVGHFKYAERCTLQAAGCPHPSRWKGRMVQTWCMPS